MQQLLAAQSDRHVAEPYTLKEALKGPNAEKWLSAAVDEIVTLTTNGTWQPVQLPKGAKPIGCRWVFKVKHNADGTVERYRARLVAKGYSQHPGFDYDEKFSPTAKWVALRCILAIVALEDLQCESVDITSAFTYGKMEHDAYMQLPEGYQHLPGLENLGPHIVLKLLKVLYGLKQAGR